MEKEKQAFYDFWNNSGELFASMANGNIKQFAEDVWNSALTVKDIEELEETTNRDKQLYTQGDIDNLKKEIADLKVRIEKTENAYCGIFDKWEALKAEIERKDEAIVKAKLIIEKHNRWTGQATVQGHVPDHSARIAVKWLDRALKWWLK